MVGRHGRPEPALLDHDGAARREGPGDRRQRRRRVRRARLRLGLRRRHRRAGLALLHGPRRSREAVREPRARGRGEDLGLLRGVLEGGRRRDRLGRGRLRSRARSPVRRNRQRLALEPLRAQPGRRRQPLRLVDPGASPRHRKAGLALPDDARRRLGLHRDTAPPARRSRDRRQAPQGADAGAEERLLLRARPRDGGADLGRGVRDGHLGEGDRQEDRTPDRGGRPRLPHEAGRGEALAARRAQLAPDVVQPEDGTRLHPDQRDPVLLQARAPSSNTCPARPTWATT